PGAQENGSRRTIRKLPEIERRPLPASRQRQPQIGRDIDDNRYFTRLIEKAPGTAFVKRDFQPSDVQTGRCDLARRNADLGGNLLLLTGPLAEGKENEAAPGVQGF